MTRRLLVPALGFAVLLLVAAPARADWVWPVAGEVITPYRFGGDPYAAGQHRGIDIAAADGAPVVAAAPGEVRFAGTVGSSGLTIGIRTADGRYDTSYLHLSSASVREGQQVAARQRVGTVGTTGERSARQPHLHFGVRDAGTAHGYHDPLGFLPPAAGAPDAPRGEPSPHATPVTVGPGPAVSEASVLAPASRPAVRGVPARHTAPGPVGEPAPHLAPGRPRLRSQRALPQRAPGPSHHAAHSPHPTTGAPVWAALLGAAALLGLSASGRTAARTPGRRRVAALLKPRLGAR